MQASIILRRKASKAEELQEAREELATAERELRERSNQAQASEGGEVVRGDEVHHLIFFFHSQRNARAKYLLAFSRKSRVDLINLDGQ